MHNFLVQAVGQRAVEDNARVEEFYSNWANYVQWFHANALDSVASGTPPIKRSPTIGGGPSWSLAPVAGTFAVLRGARPRPKTWRLGVASLRIFWCAHSAAAGNIVFNARVNSYALGDSLVVGAGAALRHVIPAPGVADTLQVLLSSNAQPFDDQHQWLSVAVNREKAADDTYPDPVYVFGVEVLYTEDRRQVGEEFAR